MFLSPGRKADEPILLDYEDGWGLVRPSNTTPVIVTRFEASSPEKLTEIQDIVMNKVNEFKDE